MMNTIQKLMGLSSAEEFFVELDVAYQPEVVHVARLHILRRMGQYLREAELNTMDDDALRAACRDTLERAYGDFLTSSPIAERLFKVHQDAIKPSPAPEKPFVPLSALTTISTGAV